MTKTGHGRSTLGAALLLGLLTASPASAAVIQIGTFGWESVTGLEALGCNFVEPCARFTLTNDLGTLALLDPDALMQINAQGDEALAGAQILELPGVDGFLGDVDAGFSAQLYSAAALLSATLSFTPPGGIAGIVLFPSLDLTQPPGDPLPIYVQVPGVSEPATLGLLVLGLAAMRRRRSHRTTG